MMSQMDGTKKKLILVGLLGVVLVVGMGIVGVKIYQKSQVKQEEEFVSTLKMNKPEEMPVGMPQKAFYDYDPTEHKAMFIIEAVESASKTMQLKFIYPFKLRDNVITAKVTCGRKETWIFGRDNEVVPADKTVYEEERIVLGKTVMQGMCSDQYCRAIRKYCELWL